MKHLLSDVRAFHEACGVPVVESPRLASFKRALLRKELLWEEYSETVQAIFDDDLEGIADGLADLIYVAVGAALEYGIPLEKVWDEVQRSNMAKVDPVTGKVNRREDGKILKPEGWTPPDIARVLEESGR